MRAIRHCRVGISPESPLAFHEEETNWGDFFNGFFADKLIPHFINMSHLISQESLKNAMVEDEKFLNHLPEKLSDKLAREIYGAEADEAFEPQVTSTELKTKKR